MKTSTCLSEEYHSSQFLSQFTSLVPGILKTILLSVNGLTSIILWQQAQIHLATWLNKHTS